MLCLTSDIVQIQVQTSQKQLQLHHKATPRFTVIQDCSRARPFSREQVNFTRQDRSSNCCNGFVSRSPHPSFASFLTD